MLLPFMDGFSRTFYQEYFNSNNRISSGIPSLDDLVCLDSNTMTAIYEDENSFFHQTILQVFVSEMVSRPEAAIKILSMEDKLLTRFEHKKEFADEKDSEKLIIAWRYSNLNRKTEKFKWNLSEKVRVPDKTVLRDITELLEEMKNTRNTIFIVYSLFSPLFEKCDVINKLYLMRMYCKLNGHTVFLSIPKFLINEKNVIELFFDNIFQITVELTMTGEDSIYQYFLNLLKLGEFGKLYNNTLDSFKYGIRFSSKKILIESIEIPPEVNDTGPHCGNSF